MTSIQRTYHPKWTVYRGDGFGKDHYILFNNGGLNEQRMYGGTCPPIWRDTKMTGQVKTVPSRAASSIRYWGDGSGRDAHVIFDQGQKRSYSSNWQNFANKLRTPTATPHWERRQIIANSPQSHDLSLYNNWHSPKNRKRFSEQAKE